MADFPADFFFSSIAGIGAKLRAREFSATELTRAYLERLERLGPRYNALALLLRQQAMRKAKEVDGDFSRGRIRGPLHGIPFAAKDLLSVAGQLTTWGAKPYAGQVLDTTATVLERLDRAGAILIGKLAMIQLAGGGGYRYAAASLFGPCLNPWDRSRWAGGSSSGSGAAVAAGLTPWAIGTETSGSIVTPAAFSGVTGLRPTYGLVSRHGAMALSWTLDKIGPMCRTAEDCGLALQVMAGKDDNDPGSLGKSFYYAPAFAREMKDIRIGYAPSDFEEWPAPEAREAFKIALSVIRDTGVQMTETALPSHPYGLLVSTIISAEAASIFEDLIESGRVDELADRKQIAGLKAALAMESRDYLKAMRLRRLVQQDLRRQLAEIDVLIAPARAGVAPKIAQPLDAPGPSTPAKPGIGPSLIQAGNLAGLPSLTLPCGFVDGLPVALQIVGRPLLENTLLAIGRAFQARTDWHRKHPQES